MRKFSQLFVGLLLISILASSQLTVIHAQTAGGISIKLNLAPSIVESGSGTHSVGYISLQKSGGIPIPAYGDVEIQLSSSDPSVASVPSSVVIPNGHDFARFDVSTGVDGQTEIFGKYGAQVSSQKFRVGEIPVIVPEDTELKINLPSSLMRVNTEMPVAVFLQ